MKSGEDMLKSVCIAVVSCRSSHGNCPPLCISAEQHLCGKGEAKNSTSGGSTWVYLFWKNDAGPALDSLLTDVSNSEAETMLFAK
jgi:hypothetical protein